MSTPSSDTTARLGHLRRTAAAAGLDSADIVLPTSRQMILRGMRFHYLEWPSAGRPPLLFLHGGGLTAHTWDLVCHALRPAHRCVAVDLRGHGDSEWSPEMDYSLAAHADDVAALVDQLGDERPVVVGMSLGGLVALSYAADHHDRLAGLVIVDVGLRVRREAAERIRSFMVAREAFDSLDQAVADAVAFNPRRDPESLRHSLLANLRRLPDGRWSWKYDRRHRANRDYLTGLEHEMAALEQRIGAINCPALVVRGANSTSFLDDDADQLVAALPRASQVRVADAGHTVQGDNPRDLVAAVARFLGQIAD